MARLSKVYSVLAMHFGLQMNPNELIGRDVDSLRTACQIPSEQNRHSTCPAINRLSLPYFCL